MFGNNPLRLPEKGDGQTLQVQEIFPTLQGEGPFTGHPAVFIRMGGCNLACAFCDTEFESYHGIALMDVLAEVKSQAEGSRELVVITGGEPLRQPIAPLCQALLEGGFMVQIETNGTLWRKDMPEDVHIVCSPKNNEGRGYAPVRPDVLSRLQALKFIISASREGYKDVGEVGQAASGTPVYVQPMDEYDEVKNAANLQHTVALAQERGYRLSLQTHKLLGLP